MAVFSSQHHCPHDLRLSRHRCRNPHPNLRVEGNGHSKGDCRGGAMSGPPDSIFGAGCPSVTQVYCFLKHMGQEHPRIRTTLTRFLLFPTIQSESANPFFFPSDTSSQGFDFLASSRPSAPEEVGMVPKQSPILNLPAEDGALSGTCWVPRCRPHVPGTQRSPPPAGPRSPPPPWALPTHLS